MNTRKHELGSRQNTVELAVAELDAVSGGRRAIEGEIQYLNWIKTIYAPWANMTIGGGRTAIC